MSGREVATLIEQERETWGRDENPSGWLFPCKRSRSGHVDSMTITFRRCVKAAGLDQTRVTPHTMRHTAITRFANTVPRPTLPMLQRFSGHLSLTALKRYLHATADDVRSGLDKLWKRVRERNKPTWLRFENLDTITPGLHTATYSSRLPRSRIRRKNGAPGRSRTCDLRIRSPLLYPAELRARDG